MTAYLDRIKSKKSSPPYGTEVSKVPEGDEKLSYSYGTEVSKVPEAPFDTFDTAPSLVPESFSPRKATAEERAALVRLFPERPWTGPPYPSGPCSACGNRHFMRPAGSITWLCSTCHPLPADGARDTFTLSPNIANGGPWKPLQRLAGRWGNLVEC